MDYNAIGERIRNERIHLNLTQQQLADMVGVGLSHIGYIERGKRACSIETLNNLSNALNISIDYILKGENDFNINSSHLRFQKIIQDCDDSQIDSILEIINIAVRLSSK